MTLSASIHEKVSKALTTGKLNLKNQNPKLSDQDIAELAVLLENHPGITDLDVTQNDIGPAGAQILAENKTLRTLRLYNGNAIGSNGLDPFLQNTTLKEFPINGGSSESIKKIRAHMSRDRRNRDVPQETMLSSNAKMEAPPLTPTTLELNTAPIVELVSNESNEISIIPQMPIEADPFADELGILKELYSPVVVNYSENLNNFANLAALQDCLFRSDYPPLTHPYDLWCFDGKNPTLMRYQGVSNVDVRIVPFGTFAEQSRRTEPDGKNRNVSFTVSFNGDIYQSFAITKDSKSSSREMPSSNDFKVPNFKYNRNAAFGSPTAGNYHTPGHCIDDKDTPNNPGLCSTTAYPENFIPEPPNSYWGLHIRNPLVGAIRRSGKGEAKGGIYVQYPYYSLNPLKTNGGYSVPEGVYFSAHSFNGKIKPYVLNIRWDDDFSKFIEKYPGESRYKNAFTEFPENPAAMPFAALFDVNWSSQELNTRLVYHAQLAMKFKSTQLALESKNQITPAFNAMQAFQHHLSYAAKLESTNASCKLELAKHHAEQGDFVQATDYLKAATAQTKKLFPLDRNISLIDKTQLDSVRKFWEESHEELVAFWEQMYNDGPAQTSENTQARPFMLSSSGKAAATAQVNLQSSASTATPKQGGATRIFN